jgi:hypothetical protein
MLAHNKSLKLAGFAEVTPMRAAQDADAIELPDLRAAVTSKNVQGWRPDQRPPVAGPPRPAASPFTDSMARDVFDVGRTVDAPAGANLKTAIDAHKTRSEKS